MMHKLSYRNFSSKNLRLDRSDSRTQLSQLKEKLSFRESPIDVTHDSKVSSALYKNARDDSSSQRKIDHPQNTTTLSSSPSSVRLPVLTNRGSELRKDASDLLSSKILRSQASSPKFWLVPPRSPIMFDKVNMNSSQDLASINYSYHLEKVFNSWPHKGRKVQTNYGIKRITVSVSNARRIVKCLEEDLKKALKQPTSGELTAEDQPMLHQTLHDQQLKIVEDLKLAVEEILLKCDKALDDMNVQYKLEEDIKDIIEIAKQADNAELTLYCFYTEAKLLMVRGHLKEAVMYFKQYKNICLVHKLFKNKIFAHKNLGKCFQGLKKNRIALIYFTKFLQMSWYLGSTKNELLAYEWIGMQYYYLGETKKAIYFHNKSVTGGAEPLSSELRQVGIQRLQIENRLGPGNRNRRAKLGDNSYSRDNTIDADEEDEVSSIDEAIDLSHLTGEGNKPVEREKKTAEPTYLGKNRKDIKMRKLENYVSGLYRAEMAKKQETRRNEYPVQKAKHSMRAEGEKSLNNPQPPLMSRHFGKPNEHIFATHLSRNRHNMNFAIVIPHNSAQYDEKSSLIVPDVCTTTTADRIKKVLEKFKVNISLIKQTLELYEMDQEEILSQNLSRKSPYKLF